MLTVLKQSDYSLLLHQAVRIQGLQYNVKLTL